MSLHDQHLKQALNHAPDSDIVPNDFTRAAVLNYANQAVKRRDKSWLNRTSNLLREWLDSSWHMAGVGSAVATILVVVVFWHEMADDAMRKVATPSEETKIGTTDSPAEAVPEAASAQKYSETVDENVAAIDQMTSKAKSASPATPASQQKLTNAGKPVQKNSGLAEAIPHTPAPVELEIPVVAASIVQDKAVAAPAAAVSSVGATPMVTKGELSKEIQAENDASLGVRRENIPAKKSVAKADVLSSAAPKSATELQDSQAFLARIKADGGKALANQDIQVGNLRLLKVEMQSKDLDTLNCPQLMDKTIAVDILTGYRIESVGSCDATDSLLKEVEIYNQVMLDWHSNHPR